MKTEQVYKTYKEYQDDIISWWGEYCRKTINDEAKKLRRQRKIEKLKSKRREKYARGKTG